MLTARAPPDLNNGISMIEAANVDALHHHAKALFAAIKHK